jgi:hypothetical protein
MSCGTQPEAQPGNVRLEIEDNQPYVHIEPPEEPVGSANCYVTDHSENYYGFWRSFSERIEYDNMTIYREVSRIAYYDHWYHGFIKSYEETRRFEPMGIEKDIEIDYCLYNASLNLINYQALVNDIPYYYSGEFDPDNAYYDQFP